jgi:uncharacterized protein YciI
MSAFIILISYVAPLEDVDKLMDAHVAWLREQHRAGHFLAWGRQHPRTGGVILARGSSRDETEALAASDPFFIGGVSSAEVIEWTPSFAAEGFEALKT